ncbi:MAG: hypothetical protein ACLQB1_17605 [Streptosporangiaceae bacterium]
MSSLWSVRVEQISPDSVTLRIRAVHPDAGDVPESRAFALRVLSDLDPRAERLTREEGDGAYQDEEIIGRVARRAIAEVVVTERQTFASAGRRIGEDLRARGLDPADRRAWSAAYDDAWQALWQDSSRAPSALVTIRLADRSWLAGLNVGGSWDSPAYG